MLVMAMRYADVNQLTSVEAPRSMAMGDWMVVMRLTLFVKMKMRIQIETHMSDPRRAESVPSCDAGYFGRESGGDCLETPFNAEAVLGEGRRGVLSASSTLATIADFRERFDRQVLRSRDRSLRYAGNKT